MIVAATHAYECLRIFSIFQGVVIRGRMNIENKIEKFQ